MILRLVVCLFLGFVYGTLSCAEGMHTLRVVESPSNLNRKG